MMNVVENLDESQAASTSKGHNTHCVKVAKNKRKHKQTKHNKRKQQKLLKKAFRENTQTKKKGSPSSNSTSTLKHHPLFFFPMMNCVKTNSELAYWKSRAISLEYENKVLQEVIRRLTLQDHQSQTCEQNDPEVESDDFTSSDSNSCDNHNYSGKNIPDCNEVEYSETEDDNVEISDEFVKFLVENEKFRREARKDREKFRNNVNEEEVNEKELRPKHDNSVDTGEKMEKFKKMYGSEWLNITGLKDNNSVLSEEISSPKGHSESTDKFITSNVTHS